MRDQADMAQAGDETGTVASGSGDPNDDRAFLQHLPPAQVNERRPSPVEEDEDPISHDAQAAQEGGA